MIVMEVFSRARDLLADTAEPYRWSPGILLSWLNDGVRELRTERPDACFDDTGVAIADADIEDELPYPRQYRTALVHYLCYRAFMRDSADTANKAQAEMHYSQFKVGIGKG